MWADIGIAVLLLVGIYCVLSVFGWWAKITTRRVNRTAEDWYDRCADSPRQQRRYAKQHGGEWTDEPADWPDRRAQRTEHH